MSWARKNGSEVGSEGVHFDGGRLEEMGEMAGSRREPAQTTLGRNEHAVARHSSLV